MFLFLKLLIEHLENHSIVIWGPNNEVLVVEYFGG